MAYNFAKQSRISKSEGMLKGDGSAILIGFVVVLLAIAFLTPSANSVYTGTTQFTVANESFNSSNGTVNFAFGKAVSSVVVYNSTDNIIVSSGNYTVNNYQNVNGVPTAQLVIATQPLYSCANYPAGCNWNVSYTYEPLGYVGSGGANTIFKTVIIFFALAILVFVITNFYKRGSFGRLMRS